MLRTLVIIRLMSYNSERVKAWRHAHPEVSRLSDRLYKSMKRSYLFKRYWPEILAHYGGCVRVDCKHKDMPVFPDHVVSVMEHPECNNLLNLQPLCRSCNSVKGRWAHDYRPDKGLWISQTIPEALEIFHRCMRVGVSPVVRVSPNLLPRIHKQRIHTCQTPTAYRMQQYRIKRGLIHSTRRGVKLTNIVASDVFVANPCHIPGR